MIYKSNEREFLNSFPNEDISDICDIFKVQDGINIAFILLNNDGKYPKTFKISEFDDDRLTVEICNILARYYVLPNIYRNNTENKEPFYVGKNIKLSYVPLISVSIIFITAIALSWFYLNDFQLLNIFAVGYVIYLIYTIWEVIRWYRY